MVRFRTLGTLDLTDANGRELGSLLAQPKRVALFAYLTLAAPRGPHRRDRLIALFWPEHDEEHARNSLSQAVRFLRRSLGEDTLVGRNGGEIGVAVDRLSCDALDFEAAVEGGRLAEALDLYTGDLLDAFHVADVPEFQRWLEVERARLARLYLTALESVAGELEARGDYPGAIVHWRRTAARDPLSSRIALRLMRAMAAAGDPGAAVQHARVHMELLREELGVAPDPAIAALVRELSSARATPGSARVPAAESPIPAGEIVAVPGVVTAPPIRSERKRIRRLPLPLTVGIVALAVLSLTALHVRRQQAETASYLQELYERGRFAENSRSYIGLQTAKAAYTMAIERDPEYALGYAGLAGVYGFMADYAFAPVGPALDTARMMAMRAIQYGDELSDVHMARAVTLGDAHEFDVAEREFQRAIELDETNGRAHYWYGVLLVALGRGAEALEHIRLAEKHDPFPMRGLTAMGRYAQWEIDGTRTYRQMPIEDRRPVLKAEPGEPWAHAREALDLAEVKKCTEAREKLALAEDLAPDNARMLRFVGAVYWWCGEQDRARELVDSMKRRIDAGDHGYRIAQLHVLFGENDSAFVWLGRHRWTMAELTALRASHYLDPLRSDQRYLQLLKQVGIQSPD